MEVIHGDAVTELRRIADASVDAVITDPPYCSGGVSEASRVAADGQGLRSETLKKLGWFVGDNMGTAGLIFLLRAVAFEATRFLKPSGSFLVFCDWRMQPNLAPALESAGLRYQNLIVWDKQSMGLGAGFRTQHELILHFTAGRPQYHNKATSNVIRCKRVTAAEREHQTQKPVELLEQLLEVVTPPGGLAVDPFGGSGSLLVAAHKTGRRAICIERDAAHVATSWGRFAAAIA